MNVQVKDGLSRARANVQHCAVSLLNVALPRDLSGGEVAAPDEFSITGPRLFQSREMLARNDQHMRGRLRIDVFEGEDVLVLVNLFRRNLAVKNTAEKTAGGSVSHRRRERLRSPEG